MKKHSFLLTLILIVCSFLMQSCNSSLAPYEENEDILTDEDVSTGSISFNSQINPLTKATESGFETNDNIGVFAVEYSANNIYGELSSSTSGNYANNVEYIYSNGKFSSTTPIIYDNEDQKLFFHAIYPYSTNLSSDFNFAVNLDQSTTSGYSTSDLMVASTDAVNSTTPTLSFNHKFSNVIINITESDVPLSNVSVSFQALYNASCNINKNEYTGINSSSSITAASNGTNSYKVILPPQTIAAGSEFAVITISGVNYVWTLSETLSFKSGIQYSYDLTVKDSGIKFEGVINSWGEENDIEEFIPSDLLGEMANHMQIYEGINPPNIEGCYLLDELTVVYCEDYASGGGYAPGYNNFVDLYIEFSDQDNKALTLNIQTQEGTTVSEGSGAFIRGEGDNFTAYFETIGTSIGSSDNTINTSMVTVISGTKTTSGISDITYSFVMVSKENDINGDLMEEGVFRVFEEGDDLAVKTDVSLSESAPQNTKATNTLRTIDSRSKE